MLFNQNDERNATQRDEAMKEKSRYHKDNRQ